MKRSTCHRGHPLEPKVVPSSLLGSLGWLKHCKRCHTELKPGSVRFSCKPCDQHFCKECFALPVCRLSHTLESKLASGGWFSQPKHCSICSKSLPKDTLRYSCKPCSYHLCEPCWFSIKAPAGPPVAKPVAPAPPPAAPPGPSAPAPPCPVVPTEMKRRACKYGFQCYQKNSAHLERFVHPGDRNYRIGLVAFEGNQAPEFESLWQFFQYHDPDESGHISKDEFGDVIDSLPAMSPQTLPESLESAWEIAGGPLHGYVNFRQFVSWTQSLGVDKPLGLEEATAEVSRPCRFRLMTGEGMRCSCPSFEPTEVEGLCKCGHKASMHRSDLAERTFTEFLEASGNVNWVPDKQGLVEIADEDLLGKLQDLMTSCHKPTHNWTRDRGCKLHGVNGCGAACASKNRKPVPSGYNLVAAFRNQNADLWQKYSLVKTAILEECSRGSSDVSMEPKSVTTSGKILDSPLDDAFNEWYLFHGSTAEKCKSICSSNFRLNLAGTGATWKDPGSDVGVPLYGYGIYLAEHVTKADEYSEAIPADETVLPVLEDLEFYTVLLCRVLGGRTNVVTTNEIEREKLKADVFAGPFHSVFGDRVVTLNKPFREVVVYDKDQCYPEFLLVYERRYDG
mmetsp:Transcript_32846/g.76405  ORF Transcript_32846/g.76405 Transcript_32846/m.76405 type:complete len:620 (+) Transcript_32846:68-1927(+)